MVAEQSMIIFSWTNEAPPHIHCMHSQSIGACRLKNLQFIENRPYFMVSVTDTGLGRTYIQTQGKTRFPA